MIIAHSTTSTFSNGMRPRERGPGPLSPHLFSSPALRSISYERFKLQLDFDLSRSTPNIGFIAGVQGRKFSFTIGNVRPMVTVLVGGDARLVPSKFSMTRDRRDGTLIQVGTTDGQVTCPALGTIAKVRIKIPGQDVPEWLQRFPAEWRPQTWTSKKGRKMYGWRGKGERLQTAGSTKLERRRIRSRIEAWTRQWPYLPTHLQGATIELHAYVASIECSMILGTREYTIKLLVGSP